MIVDRTVEFIGTRVAPFLEHGMGDDARQYVHLLFSIAVASAHQVPVDPRPCAIAVAVAASNSFLTPIGYQTTTMVYGPGGYRYIDYIRVGFPLTIATVITAVLVIPWAWRL
jgi:di/tricarboxylate transporter